MISLRLRTILFSVFSLITVLLTGTIIFFYTQSLKEQAIQGITQWGKSLSSSASAIIVDYIIEEDYAGLQEIVTGYANTPWVLRALIVDPEAIILADSQFSAFGTSLPLLNNDAFLKQGRTSIFVEQHQDSFMVTTPVLFDDVSFGYIYVVISKQPLLDQLWNLKKKTVQVGIFWGAICLLLSWFLARFLTQSLEKLAGVAEKIALGSYQLTPQQKGIVEIENLCTSLHNMSSTLEEREKLLLASEKKYREIFENAIEGIFQATIEGRFMTVNPRMAILLGYNTAQELLHHIADIGNQLFVEPQDLAYLQDLLKRDNTVFGFETRLFQKMGHIIWVSLNVHIVKDTDDTPLFLEGLIEDITERKKSSEELMAERERLSVTLRSIGDAVITTDITGRITLMNKMAESITCWSQKEASGLALEEVFRVIDRKSGEPGENPATKVLQSGLVEHIANDTILIDKTNKEKSISDSAAPIRDKESKIIGVVIVFRDVTENNRMEEELLKVKKLESVGILAGGIAHDFNNILAAIVGNLNLALMDNSIEEKTRKLLIGAEKASLRAKNLTLQLLTFSKGGEPVKETSSVAEIITDSADFVLHGSNVICHYNFPQYLWLVDIDKGQMSQVIQNIIINSRHAMPKGGTIDVQCENVVSAKVGSSLQNFPQNGIKITISDTGVGIPSNVIDRVFDPYFSTRQKGSGLGLAISNSIIRKHNGRILVQSLPGKGTTFTIYLPASTHQEEPEKQLKNQKKNLPSSRIMVMDDEELVRDVAEAMLLQLGHKTILVEDGAEALRTYQAQMDNDEPVNAVIMDLTIPGGVGGKDAVQNILAIDPTARVIVSSGYSNDPIMANYQEYGFVAAVVKPYQVNELEKILEKALAAPE